MKERILAADLPGIFGTVKPPIQGMPSDPVEAISRFFSFGVKAFIIVCSLVMLLYMLWGAFDWIASSGEKDKIAKAQNKITNAVIGIVILIAVLSIFGLVTGDILGIIVNNNGAWEFKLPRIVAPTP